MRRLDTLKPLQLDKEGDSIAKSNRALSARQRPSESSRFGNSTLKKASSLKKLDVVSYKNPFLE